MSHTTLVSPVSTAWASAMLELANESDAAPAIGEELRQVRMLVEANAQFAQLLADPAIGHAEREKLLRDMFTGRCSTLILNLLLLMNEKGRLANIAAVSHAYDALLDEQLGKAEVDLTVAQALSPSQLDQVRQEVGAAIHKDASVVQHVDPSILGGLIVKVQDRFIDGSVRAQLAAMRRQLLEARPI